jgi:hypothetical protein
MRSAAGLLLLGLALLGGGPLKAEPLGRLFFTPERRAMLERQRQQNIQAAQVLEGSVMRLDGVVTRSSGKTTVWINRRPQHENTVGTGVTAALVTKNPGRAVLTPTDEAPAPLRVGEAINRGTREKTDGLGSGRVTVDRHP